VSFTFKDSVLAEVRRSEVRLPADLARAPVWSATVPEILPVPPSPDPRLD
jgi:hypothetical protein